MKHKQADNLLSDRALERVMRDVLDGLREFSTDLLGGHGPKASAQNGQMVNTSALRTLPRCTSLHSGDLLQRH